MLQQQIYGGITHRLRTDATEGKQEAVKRRSNLTLAQGVAGIAWGGSILLLLDGFFHPALTVALAGGVLFLAGQLARDRRRRDAERLEELALRSHLAASPTPPPAASTTALDSSREEADRLKREHAREVAALELLIADRDARIQDLGNEYPEFAGWKHDVAALESELAAMRAALADMTRAFLSEVMALHAANEALRFDHAARVHELAAVRAALTELAIACFLERATLQESLRQVAEDAVRDEVDALDSFGLDLLARVHQLEAQLAEMGAVPWIRGLLLSAALHRDPEKLVPVFFVRLNGHAEVRLTDAASEQLSYPV